jgi:arginase family enzyme
MLHNSIRVLNFDNTVACQGRLLSSFRHEIIDLTDMGPYLRLFAGGPLRQQLKRRIVHSDNLAPTFLGSGDFHHISELLIAEQPDIRSVLVFDFHPDLDSLPPHFGCGSWVSRMLKNRNIKKCVIIGVGSEDISSGPLQSADLSALSNDRLEIYPFRHSPSKVYFKNVAQNISIRSKGNFFLRQLYWEQLEDKDMGSFIQGIISRLPAGKVYLSIDKDCLLEDAAVTNWEAGFLSLRQLLLMLEKLKNTVDISGLDITGDYSPAVLANRFKALLSRLDHPAGKGVVSMLDAQEINQETNSRILKTLGF